MQVMIFIYADLYVLRSLPPEHVCSAFLPDQEDLVNGPRSGSHSPMTTEIEKAWGARWGQRLVSLAKSR